MGQVQYTNVLLPIPIPQVFTYEIPEELVSRLKVGQRVIVQFGPRKVLSALVWEIHQQKPEHEAKTLLGLLDQDPVINPYQQKFWEWLADYYICSLGEVMKAAFPAGLKLESHTRILVNENFEAPEGLSEIEELAWLYLLKNPGVKIQDLGDVLKRKNPFPIVQSLNQRGAIRLEEKLIESYKPRIQSYLELAPEWRSDEALHQVLDQLIRAPKQKASLEAYISQINQEADEPVWIIEHSLLLKCDGVSSAALSSLVSKKILVKTHEHKSRLEGFNADVEDPKTLNKMQLQALKQLRDFDVIKPVTLIHGVTSSGKTEVYIHRIMDMIDLGKQVLYLLPEIALTEQIINRLRRVFGDTVGVFHSKYSDSERVEVWNDINLPDGRYKLILGARSSLFLPFSKLGLIIIDEEHETSYKQQDPAPRYHARDAAIVLGQIHQAQVVLGTATPALESYFNAQTGKYNLIELTERYSEIPLPEILIANAKEAYRKKKITGHFTPELLEAVDQALVNKEQIILFQNRRGYSPYLECGSCGHIPKCRDCDVSLTLHKYKNRLVCHYCGYSEKVSPKCPSCQNSSLRTRGLGTEGLEDEIGIIFPDAQIARLDLDAARSKKGYSRILEDFEAGKTDILIGTQMVSKGLDFPNVRVVGIINADNLLHFPDFRSFERSYQLMTQVSGRAGRKEEQGLVVIQTFDPNHRVILQVKNNDYLGLYNNEMTERRGFGYPPFTRLINLTFKHKDQDLVARCAHVFAQKLRKKWTTRILGPQAPAISRVQQNHLIVILIKSAKGQELKEIRSSIINLTNRIKQDKSFKSVIIQADVDPV